MSFKKIVDTSFKRNIKYPLGWKFLSAWNTDGLPVYLDKWWNRL